MQIKKFTLCGIVGYLGLFFMGSLISDWIPWLITSGTVQPESLGLLTTLVTAVNVLLFALVLVFFLGYFLCIKEQKLLKYVCLAGAFVNLLRLVNILFMIDDYALAMAFKIMLEIMSFAVNLGFMGMTVSLHPKQKFLVAMSILAMLPFSTYPLFAAVVLWVILREQKEGAGAYQ